MSKPPLPESTQLLDDLESIRALLGDDTLEPPLLTDTVYSPAAPASEVHDEQIPMLFDEITPVAAPQPMRFEAEPASDASAQRNRQDMLLHLDTDLRSAAQRIMQEVIDDFAPHIEAEVRRRLEARLERLLNP